MKTLYLLRHGKSDWKAPYGRDHDRPLVRRGVEAAALVGDFFRRTNGDKGTEYFVGNDFAHLLPFAFF